MSISQLLFSAQGRIGRKTYWLYSLVVGSLFLIAFLFDLNLGTYDEETRMGVFSFILRLLSIFPGIMVSIKRSHDRNHSGWFVLLLLIPFINLWPLIELSFFAGTDGPNQYGKDPRRHELSQAIGSA